MRRLRLLFSLLLLLIPLLIAEDPPRPAPSPRAAAVAAPHRKPAPSVPSRRQARVRGPYDAKQIETKLRSSRLAIAGCFLRDRDYGASQIRLRLGWEGSGNLREINLVPPAQAPIRDCLRQLVADWSLEPHPSLQPFVFSTTLVLGPR